MRHLDVPDGHDLVHIALSEDVVHPDDADGARGHGSRKQFAVTHNIAHRVLEVPPGDIGQSAVALRVGLDDGRVDAREQVTQVEPVGKLPLLV